MYFRQPQPTTAAAATTTEETTAPAAAATTAPPASAADSSSYDPCAIADACGPNAVCSSRGSEPACSCPPGFGGIPRDGTPDPAHGCVRTPEKCVSQPEDEDRRQSRRR